MQLKNLSNFRELGGYQIGSKKIKKNALYRSDELCFLNDSEKNYLYDTLAIDTVIDFRGADEVHSNPDILDENINYFHLSIQTEVAERASENKSITKRKTTAEKIKAGETKDLYTISDGLKTLMRDLVRKESCRRIFSKMFEVYLNDQSKIVLQHCRGGKDRTGFGCAILMGALGASKESIFENYLMTNEFKKDDIEKKMSEYAALTDDTLLLNELNKILVVREEYLDASLQEMEKLFGGLEGFLEIGLGIDSNKRNQLAYKYLE